MILLLHPDAPPRVFVVASVMIFIVQHSSVDVGYYLKRTDIDIFNNFIISGAQPQVHSNPKASTRDFSHPYMTNEQ